MRRAGLGLVWGWGSVSVCGAREVLGLGSPQQLLVTLFVLP